MIAGRLAQGATQGDDALAEIVLFDDAVGPHRFHQLFFMKQLTRVLDQEKQRVERARG
ncbi:MAG TPA: hypothetical protein VKA19_13450 [Alphaproteobacteria bacterium]|nr:hypothetical protein [Alphaproteobacteria bacterium]